MYNLELASNNEKSEIGYTQFHFFIFSGWFCIAIKLNID